MKTSANTVKPQSTAKGHRYHPMAATGATIDLTAGANCGSTGALYAIGCSLTWVATNNVDWSATDSYADYYVPPNATTATLDGTNGYTGADPGHTTTLNIAGTWTFFVYDTTAQVIISTVYVNAGQAFQIGVYQDPYHTQSSYQFNVNSSSAAYIYLPDVSTNDTYVVYVMSTSVNSYCVFITPAATPQPGSPSPMPTGSPNKLLCNPANSPGISAPSGSLSLEWPINNSYQAGTYSVVVYDKTAGETVGQVQVSLTGFLQYGFLLYASPGPNPSPAAPATPTSTVFAWDNANEQSDAGIYATVPNQLGTAPDNGSYRMTATDPDGQVVELPSVPSIPASCTATANSAANCTATGTFQFSSASPTLNAPGNYPNNTWTMQLYAPGTQTVEASQAFELVGYSMQTLFDVSGVEGDTITFGCCTSGTVYSVTGSMVFTNTANFNYPNAADPLRGIEYTTGPAATLTTTSGFAPPSSTTGYGVTVALSGCSGTYNTTGCSETVTDSSGNSWTLTDHCSTATPSTPTLTGQCVLKFTPSNNVALLPGKSITVSGMTWYAEGGTNSWSCYNVPCSTTTSILPQDGLTWSSTGTSSPAWTPVYYGSSNSSIIGTVNAHYIGSATFPGNTSRNTVAQATNPPTLPWTNTHFYPSEFAQAEYQNSTPFAITAGREDVLVINLSTCKASGNPAPSCSGASAESLGEIGITFPTTIDAAEITIDPSEPENASGTYYVLSTNGGNACQNTLSSNAICLNPGATSYSGTGNENDVGTPVGDQSQIWLDVPASQAAYIAQELQVQAWSTQELTWTTLTADGNTETPVDGGGVAGSPVDSLSIQGLSLNSNLMAAQFDPSTVSPGATTTTYSLAFSNTSTAADPNPDPVDAIVLEEATSNGWTLTAPSFSGTGSAGWSNLSGTGYNVAGSSMEYWFGVCTNQYTNHTTAGPPQSPPSPTNPTTAQTALGAGCTAAQEEDAVAAGGSMTINFTLANTATGTQTFYLYAHGANGGGWSAPKTITVTSSSKTASTKLYSVAQGSTDASCDTTSNVSTNTVAQVAKSPVCFIYEVTNTSSSGQDIGTVNISLPAYDINGLATSNGPPIDWSLVGSPVTQYVVLGTISGGTFTTTGIPAGCSINTSNTYNPTPGSSAGQIQVSGCTGFANGDNIAVEFVANTPDVESDSYLLPATIDGATSGLAWTGSNEVTVAFSLGLSVSVDPANPGPGNSHPSVICNPAQCTFSGETVNFGEFGANTTITGSDVVRATVVYEGSSLSGTCPAGAGAATNTWQLQVSVNNNASGELYTSVDETNSTSGLTYGTGAGTYFNPTTSVTTLACGNETSSTDYDVLQNFEVINGSDTSGHAITVTYTLVSN